MKLMTALAALCIFLSAVCAMEAAEAAPAAGAPAAAKAAKKKGGGLPDFLGSATNSAAREAVITSEHSEYDRKEGVILFDGKVKVDDARFTLHADKLLVFLEGTNAVKQIMALGAVSITNENRSARCDKAVYTKENGQIVMTGGARLKEGGDKGGEVVGEQITFWLDDERMEVTKGSRVVLPAGALQGGGMKDAKKDGAGK